MLRQLALLKSVARRVSSFISKNYRGSYASSIRRRVVDHSNVLRGNLPFMLGDNEYVRKIDSLGAIAEFSVAMQPPERDNV